jgi:hypothetical protein
MHAENPELKHYIDTQLAGGTSREELKKLLVHHGWAPEIVDSHLQKATLQTPPLVKFGFNDPAGGSSNDDIGKKRKFAIFMIVAPFALLLLVLTAYAIAQFAISNMRFDDQATVAPCYDANNMPCATGLGQEDRRLVIAKIVNVALSLLGTLAFLSIFVLVPIGIVLLIRSRRELGLGAAYDERSGKGDASIIPPEISGWNWGAAFLSFWWGIYYRVWLMLLIFVPVIGPIWWIVMGIKGNEWAWRRNKWVSVGEFKVEQKKWAVWAIGLLIIQAIIMMTVFGFMKVGTAILGK